MDTCDVLLFADPYVWIVVVVDILSSTVCRSNEQAFLDVHECCGDARLSYDIHGFFGVVETGDPPSATSYIYPSF